MSLLNNKTKFGWITLKLVKFQAPSSEMNETDPIKITDVNLNWQDPYTGLDGHVVAKAGILLLCPVYLVIGTMLVTGLISFERHGGDPQKRSLHNQVGLVM